MSLDQVDFGSVYYCNIDCESRDPALRFAKTFGEFLRIVEPDNAVEQRAADEIFYHEYFHPRPVQGPPWTTEGGLLAEFNRFSQKSFLQGEHEGSCSTTLNRSAQN